MLPDHFSILMAVTDSVSLAVRRTITRHIAWLKTRRMILPLLGERAGVRADIISDFMVNSSLRKPQNYCCHFAFFC